MCLVTFMISRPTLSCSHWLEFVYTDRCVANQLICLSVTSFWTSFYNVSRQHVDYIHDVISSFLSDLLIFIRDSIRNHTNIQHTHLENPQNI